MQIPEFCQWILIYITLKQRCRHLLHTTFSSLAAQLLFWQFPMHPVTKMSSFWRYTSNNFCFNVLATRTFNIQFSWYFLPPEFFLVCFFIVFPLPVIDYFIFAKPIDHFFLLVFGQIGIFVLLFLNIWRALCFGQFSIIVTTLWMTLKIWDFLLVPLGFLSIISMVIRVSFWSSYSYCMDWHPYTFLTLRS